MGNCIINRIQDLSWIKNDISEINSDISGVKSDLLNKQDKLTTGNGIQISNGEISNVFAELSNIDANDIKYYYGGYVSVCTNLPTGYTQGQLLCLVGQGVNSGSDVKVEQYFSPWNENLLYIRAYYGSAWTEWRLISTSPVLLWTNPSLSAAFSEQDITVPSMTPYSFIIIEFRVYKTSTSYRQSLLRRAISLANFETGTVNNLTVARAATLTNNTTITFGEGHVYNTYGTPTTYNDGMVPTRVWGVV